MDEQIKIKLEKPTGEPLFRRMEVAWFRDKPDKFSTLKKGKPVSLPKDVYKQIKGYASFVEVKETRGRKGKKEEGGE